MEDLEERNRRGETRDFYRVPSKGMTTGSKRIAQAVDDEDWQKFRHSLKGTQTSYKLYRLAMYFTGWDEAVKEEHAHINDDCNICIRVDNYLKALARGGQIASVSTGNYIDHMLRKQLTIRK